MTARKLCLQVRWHFRQRSLYVTRPRSLRKKDSSSFLFFGILGMVLLKQKSAHFSRNSRNRRIADFSVVFRGDFQGKSGHRTRPEIPRSITDRVDYALSDCLCFGYQFGVHFRRFSLMSFLPLALTTAFRSLWYARCGHGSSISCRESLRYIAGEHIPYRPVIRLE